MVAVLEKINQKLAHLPVVLVAGREGDTQSALKPDVLGAYLYNFSCQCPNGGGTREDKPETGTLAGSTCGG